jgi:uncharacterized repeat protein (TIGR03943 family)
VQRGRRIRGSLFSIYAAAHGRSNGFYGSGSHAGYQVVVDVHEGFQKTRYFDTGRTGIFNGFCGRGHTGDGLMVTGKIHRLGCIISDILPGLVCLLWIDTFIWLLTAERYKAFLQPKLYPLLVMATSILLLFLIAFAIRMPHEDLSTFKMDNWIRAAVLCLPVFFLYATYGDSLGIDALSKRILPSDVVIGPDTLSKKKSSLKYAPDGTLTLLNIARNLERLEGQKVRTIGSVYRDPNVPEGHFMLFRFVIYCCAADAMPVWLLVKSDANDTLKNETWVKIDGILRLETVKQNRIPVIEAGSIRQIPAPMPGERYLYY